MNFLENEFFLLAITFGIFFLAKLLQKKTGIMLLNPILLTIAILIIFLKMTNISYDTYNKGGHLIEFWLKPAVVALGVPLYLQLETIKKQLLPILLSQLAGCIVGVISVVLIAKLMGASDEIIYSLAPKSVTTPIAMEVTKSIGGIPALTAAVVRYFSTDCYTAKKKNNERKSTHEHYNTDPSNPDHPADGTDTV